MQRVPAAPETVPIAIATSGDHCVVGKLIPSPDNSEIEVRSTSHVRTGSFLLVVNSVPAGHCVGDWRLSSPARRYTAAVAAVALAAASIRWRQKEDQFLAPVYPSPPDVSIVAAAAPATVRPASAPPQQLSSCDPPGCPTTKARRHPVFVFVVMYLAYLIQAQQDSVKVRFSVVLISRVS